MNGLRCPFYFLELRVGVVECCVSIYSSCDVKEIRSGGVYLARTRMVWFGYLAWWRDEEIGVSWRVLSAGWRFEGTRSWFGGEDG